MMTDLFFIFFSVLPVYLYKERHTVTPLPHTAKRRYGARAPLAGWL
jgi:hypothetical protein